MKTWALLLAVLFLSPGAAEAHLVTTGFGRFYDGAAHVLVTPVDLLLVLALGLLAGLRGAGAARWVLLSLPAAWLAGGLAGMEWAPHRELPPWTALSFGLVGALVALDARLPRPAVLGLSCLAGALHGYSNGAALVASGRGWLALPGATAAVFVLVTLLPAIVVSLRPTWTRIVVRVAGSWIAAMGILWLGWLLRE
jgi:urease accessory protein